MSKKLSDLIASIRIFRNLYEACSDEIESLPGGKWTPTMELMWLDYKEARDEVFAALAAYEAEEKK